MKTGTNRFNRMMLKLTAVIAMCVPLWLQAINVPLAATAPASQFVSQGESPSNRRIRELSSDARSRIRQAISAVGLILVRNHMDSIDRIPRPRGSAVVVRQDGIIATNYHVIARDKSVELYDELYFALPRDGRITPSADSLYRLKAVLINRELDLALLKVVGAPDGDAYRSPVTFPVIEMGDSRALRELDDLVIIGYPEKGGTTVTVNSGLIEGKDILENWIKTDARLIHGNSGGAAVDSEGRLVGIPTKVVVDQQPVDKDGDGFPDSYYALGAVGFLRPANLISTMLAQFNGSATVAQSGTVTEPPAISLSQPLNVSGIIKSARDGKPIAGAAVGLTPLGTREVSAKNILTWGYTDPNGRFQLNKAVPPGRYTLQAKTFGYEIFRRDVELNQQTAQLIIELRRSE